MSISTNLRHTISSVSSQRARTLTAISIPTRKWREKSNLINLIAMAKTNNTNGTANGMAHTHTQRTHMWHRCERSWRMCGILSQPARVRGKQKALLKMHLFAKIVNESSRHRNSVHSRLLRCTDGGCLHTRFPINVFVRLCTLVNIWHFVFFSFSFLTSIAMLIYIEIQWHSSVSTKRQNHFHKLHQTQFYFNQIHAAGVNDLMESTNKIIWKCNSSREKNPIFFFLQRDCFDWPRSRLIGTNMNGSIQIRTFPCIRRHQ